MTSESDPSHVTFLTSERGTALLQSLNQAPVHELTSVHRVTQLRAQGFSATEVSAALSQAQLQHRARTKFGESAAEMLFTESGLEQATRSVVARTHAQRFVNAGITQVADLGCGIGAETIAFANAGLQVHAIEQDPLTAEFAAFNTVHLPQVTVTCADARTTRIDDGVGIFLDPARRTSGTRDTQRITNIDDYAPPLSFAYALAERHPTAVKLGPGFPRGHIPETAHAQWTSVNGDAVEMMLWFNELSTPGVTRSAMVLRDGHAHELSAPRDAPDADVRALGEYLFEPDPSLIRARLIGDLARSLGLGMIDNQIAYLTGDAPLTNPFLQGFHITEVLPASEAKLKRLLRERHIGQLEIKKRGMDIDPAALRKRLQLRGDERGTLILTRVVNERVALLCERIDRVDAPTPESE